MYKNPNIMNANLTADQYINLIRQNDGILIFKLGATWCGPCQQILPVLNKALPQMPSCVTSYIIDIDKSPEVFSLFKRKRLSSGVPIICCYYKENKEVYPDDMVVGADNNKINEFFRRTFEKAKTYQ